jgi:pyruvate, water dikinase
MPSSQPISFDYICYPLATIDAAQRPQVGEAAFCLGQSAQQGLPIVPGWVLPIAVFQQICQQAGLPTQWPETKDLNAVARQFQAQIAAVRLDGNDLAAIQQAWQTQNLPPQCQISATLAATIDPTAIELFQPSIGTIDQLALHLKQFWAEIFCARNICYWQALQQSPTTIPLATMIQAVDPRPGQSGQLWLDDQALIIETNHSGIIVVDRDTGTVLSPPSPHPAAAPTLPAPTLNALIQLSQHLGHTASQPLRLNWISDQASLRPTDRRPSRGHDPIQISSIQLDEPIVGIQLETKLKVLQAVKQQHPITTADHPHNPNLVATGIAASLEQATGRAIVIAAHQTLLSDIPPNSILVTTHLTPDWLPMIRHAAGIVTEEGGITSHAAILARALGIPAIVGVADITRSLHTGDYLKLTVGQIYRLPAPPIVDELNESMTVTARSQLVVPADVKLLATLSQPEQLQSLDQRRIQGIGLLRAEHLLLPHLDGKHPYEWLKGTEPPVRLRQQLSRSLSNILQHSGDLPIWYRTADWRSLELQHLEAAPHRREPNPSLGDHGCWSYQNHPDWLALELAAIQALSPSEQNRLRLLLPFVRTTADLQFCQQQLQPVGLANLELWVMAEVPSALFLLPEYAAIGASGIVIGVNDLTQLLLGVDRELASMSHFFDPIHPVVKQAIQQLVESSVKLKIPCHVGLSVYNNALIQWLGEIGVQGISIDAAAIS